MQVMIQGRAHPRAGVRLLMVGVAVMLWAVLAGRGWAQEHSEMAGIYRDDRVILELEPKDASKMALQYGGTIQLDDRKFPFRATAEENRLTGTFESGGDQFAFTANLVGKTLVFTTEGTTFRLTRQSTNPLAKVPAKPNPLAGSSPSSAAPGVTTPAPAPTSPGKRTTLRFRRHSVPDDPAMIGGEAFSLLVPADWQVEGGLAWRMHAGSPAYMNVRAFSSNRTEVLEAFPALLFIWTEGGIPLFRPGSTYRGYEVGEPITDPAAYIRQIIVPRFRQHIPAVELVDHEEIPAVANAVAAEAQEKGVEKKFRAARLRLEYWEQGRVMQEDVYCVLGSAHVPELRTTVWGPDRTYSFKAEKGRLESLSKVFQSVVNSYRPSLTWFNRYTQLVQLLQQGPVDTTLPVSELNRFIVQTASEVNDTRRQAYERQQAAQQRINAAFNGYIRGLAEFRSPWDGQKTALPSGYSQVWASAAGDFLLSELPSFNPNRSGDSTWKLAMREP